MEEITIPDPYPHSPGEFQKYFDRYGKLEAYGKPWRFQIAVDTASEIRHLESIFNALDIATEESDLSQIKGKS